MLSGQPPATVFCSAFSSPFSWRCFIAVSWRACLSDDRPFAYSGRVQRSSTLKKRRSCRTCGVLRKCEVRAQDCSQRCRLRGAKAEVGSGAPGKHGRAAGGDALRRRHRRRRAQLVYDAYCCAVFSFLLLIESRFCCRAVAERIPAICRQPWC